MSTLEQRRTMLRDARPYFAGLLPVFVWWVYSRCKDRRRRGGADPIHRRSVARRPPPPGRALLRQGRPYEEAVARISPYSEIRDPIPARDSLRVLIQRPREERRMAFLFVNSRLEGQLPADHHGRHGRASRARPC